MVITQLYLVIGGFLALALGAILGYYTRQSLAKRRAGTIEQALHKKVSKAKNEAEKILQESQAKARRFLEGVQQKEEAKRTELLRAERLLLKRSTLLDEKMSSFEKREKEFEQKVARLREVKQNIEALKEESEKRLAKAAGLSKEAAKKELFSALEREHQAEVLEKIRKLEQEGAEKFEKRARELLALAIQRLAVSQAQELTTSNVSLPNEEIKGRIIGKEGRNIRTLERLTGAEILVDDTPEVVVVSSFDPTRRQIAKRTLEKLIRDGRIQPARIEDEVKRAEEEIESQIREAGEAAVYEAGVVGLDPRLVKLLGRLHFRTSYGQNVLLHSIEVAHLAGALAAELGADIKVAKKAGLLHDIGKAVDHQIEGSHVAIGMKILEKFGIEAEVIDGMKAHHEEYPAETLEATLVTVADAISGARPGARKDTLENYLKRIEELEKLAAVFPGVEKAWALQAGREIRVFVKPEEIDDLSAHRLAKEIASQVEQELKYPGEIKVTVIREKRVVEYAR